MSRQPGSANMFRYRLSVLSRVLAATLGAYAVAALVSTAFAWALPLLSGASRADAVMVGTMLSFALYTVLALSVFCTRSALGAWIGLLGLGLFASLVMIGARVFS